MREAEIPTPFDYPVQYAREFFIFTIAITYSTMTPLVVPFAALYFFLAYVSGKTSRPRFLLCGTKIFFISQTQFHLLVLSSLQRKKTHDPSCGSNYLWFAPLPTNNDWNVYP
jgi:hypothetical protein